MKTSEIKNSILKGQKNFYTVTNGDETHVFTSYKEGLQDYNDFIIESKHNPDMKGQTIELYKNDPKQPDFLFNTLKKSTVIS